MDPKSFEERDRLAREAKLRELEAKYGVAAVAALGAYAEFMHKLNVRNLRIYALEV